MSVSLAAGPVHQPFQCGICQRRFTRHENLKRHATLHSRQPGDASLRCELCQTSFSRPDLRSRHVNRRHPELQGERRITKRNGSGARSSLSPKDRQHPLDSQHSSGGGPSVDLLCSEAEWSWSQNRPDGGSQTLPEGFDLSTSASSGFDGEVVYTSTSPPIDESVFNNSSTQMDHLDTESPFRMDTDYFEDALNPLGLTQSVPSNTHLNYNAPNFNRPSTSDEFPNTKIRSGGDWMPSARQIARGCDLFFNHVSGFAPFLHRPTFDAARSSSALVLSMLSLGYQYGNDPDCGGNIKSGSEMSQKCFQKARTLVASSQDKANDISQKVAIVQTLLLLQITAMMYMCGEASVHGLNMHSQMISIARAGGLMQSVPTQFGTTGDLDSLWKEFVKSESHKRTIFAMHQIDALWYQSLSIPRSLSHLEVKHELPCPAECWTAASSAEWAHRQLVARSSTSLQYGDAVRQFLSQDQDINSSPPFDPYGAVNIAQFLISSAREVSGWSTMTGVLSIERFEPLRSSLIALGPFVRSKSQSANRDSSALCEATWQTAMIELQMWSPSHTSGIIEGSLDAVLKQSTQLASSDVFACDSIMAENIRPHIDWFLKYLDETINPDTEAPWIALYSYKAFLIALQMVRAGLEGAMHVVGVGDGDVDGAVCWAREVFGRRKRWRFGELILSCLNAHSIA